MVKLLRNISYFELKVNRVPKLTTVMLFNQRHTK